MSTDESTREDETGAATIDVDVATDEDRADETSPGPTSFGRLLEQVTENASVRRVYGEPVVHGDRTVVPVAKVAYGFGGGAGEEGEDDGGSGWGGGGGVRATPAGALEITDERTRFVRYDDRQRPAILFLAGVGVGLLARALYRRLRPRPPTRRERLTREMEVRRTKASERGKQLGDVGRRAGRKGVERARERADERGVGGLIEDARSLLPGEEPEQREERRRRLSVLGRR